MVYKSMNSSDSANPNQPVVIEAKRTPIGRQGGSLRHMDVEDLTSPVIEKLLKLSGIDSRSLDGVILGNTVGPGGNVARLSLLTAQIPVEVPGFTIDMQCGSGLQAVNTAAQFILAGSGSIYLAGGVESTSLAPWKLTKPKDVYRQLPQPYNRARFAPETVGDPDMGVAAENVAQKYGISRRAQDEFALESHRRAVSAQNNGLFKDEIVPLTLPTGDVVEKDESPRPTTSMEKLSRLQPVFQVNGTVTAGNSCGINDGASVVVITSAQKAAELGYRSGLYYVDSAVVGVDPNYLGAGPIPAVQKLLTRHGLSINDISLVEFNEAFAAQVLACVNTLNMDTNRMNINGGAIALGHPYGASGGVLVTRLFQELKRQGGAYGITTLGVGGGLGVATLWKRGNL